MVSNLYSRKTLERLEKENDSEFLKIFNASLNVLNDIMDYKVDHKKVTGIIRNIENINVIPRQIYDEYNEKFEEYKKCKIQPEKYNIRKEIQKLTIGISRNYINMVGSISYMDDIYVIDKPYDEEKGLHLEKKDDPEENLQSREF
jgi:CRISPR-associated endonuclease/helicase Cas3